MYPESMKRELPPEAALHELIGGAMVTQMLAQVARLGVADELEAGPLSAEELGRRVGAHPDALYRLLRALASRGVFSEDADKRFSLTPVGNLLREHAEGSLRMWSMMNGSPWYWGAMGHAGHSVTTGKPSFEDLFGMGTFQYFREQAEAGKLFYATMSRFSEELLPHLLNQYDFSGYRHLIDVGGGHGALLSAIMEASPGMEGTLFDLPFVIEAAEDNSAKTALRLHAGDFFEAVPKGGDGYLLKYIIHDWDDEQAACILRNCRDAMDESARVMVIENVVGPRNQPCPGKMLDLTMLLLEGGRERTAGEFSDLFSRAGLQVSRIVPVLGSMCVVEGVRKS